MSTPARRTRSLELVDSRSLDILALKSDTTGEVERDQVRQCVRDMARQWALRNSRSKNRERYNALRIMAMLGVADPREEHEVLWRDWMRPRTGWFTTDRLDDPGRGS